MSKWVVHIAETKDFSPEVISRLGGFATVKLNSIPQGGLREALRECDVFWFRLGYRITKDLFDQPVRCKYILCPVTGLDHIDLDACANAGVKVLSLKGETEFLKTVRATAEHSLGLALALLRHTCSASAHARQGGWERDLFKGREIFGKSVGIFGVGRLGTIVAGYYKALGADVYGYDVAAVDTNTCKQSSSPEALFSQCDIITLHVSYHQGTHHVVDRRLLGLMKAHAILVNTARGGVINSADLLWALQNKIIAGAALDVVEDEFNISDNPLIAYARENDNLVITPHIGGNTYESFLKTEMFLCDKLETILMSR